MNILYHTFDISNILMILKSLHIFVASYKKEWSQIYKYNDNISETTRQIWGIW